MIARTTVARIAACGALAVTLTLAQDGVGAAAAGEVRYRTLFQDPGEVPATDLALEHEGRRTTAKVGDVLFVSGTIGDAALGLALAREPALAAPWGLSQADADYLIARYRRPEPRLAPGHDGAQPSPGCRRSPCRTSAGGSSVRRRRRSTRRCRSRRP